jgi:uncharacterized membrane-anchored protein YjiN (DUF445 family)
MIKQGQVGRWAVWSLVFALGVAVVGKALERVHGLAFVGGLIAAFGEASLVGGLADWFAIRALFAHPFGIPFPHTAIIPRNRVRIIGEIGALVQNEWLPRSLLVNKVNEFDFVDSGLVPVVELLKPHLAKVLRTVGRDALTDIDPAPLAAFLGRALAGSIDSERIGPFLSDLAKQTRERRWLEPLLREWVLQAHNWAASEGSHETIRRHLEDAAKSYRASGIIRRVTYRLAEGVGGVDLDVAAGVLQTEMERFTRDQLGDDSPLMDTVRQGLDKLETRLRNDPEFLADIRAFILRTAESGTLTVLLEPVLRALRIQAADSPLMPAVLHRIDEWIARLRNDPELRGQMNDWCRHLCVQLVEQHHSLIGVMVEEQLLRLSDETLSSRLEARVGEDLNWIRLNGAFVGGLVGMGLYLLFSLVTLLLG